MNKQLQTVLDRLRPELSAIRGQYGVVSVQVFGSVARGAATNESDVDLLVELERPIGLFAFQELQDHLAKILGRPVDLVTAPALKRQLRERILAEAVLAA